jgi:hypothetical protein
MEAIKRERGSVLHLILAKLVLITHVIFIFFVIVGGLLALRWRRAVWVHLPAAVWGMLIEFTDWTCPLTALEIKWLQEAGEAGYSGGFIEHYMIQLIYPVGLTSGVQLLLGFGVIAINILVYTLVWRRRRHVEAMRCDCR